MRDPDTVYLSKDTKSGKDVTIHAFVISAKTSLLVIILKFTHSVILKIVKLEMKSVLDLMQE